MPCKADMLVSEILDSALLGEGVIPFLRHALTELVIEDAVVVPQSARMFAQVVHCDCLADFHELSNRLPAGISLLRDEYAAHCRGGRLLLPIHQECLRSPLVPLTEPLPVFDFDFTVACPQISRHSEHAVTLSVMQEE